MSHQLVILIITLSPSSKALSQTQVGIVDSKIERTKPSSTFLFPAPTHIVHISYFDPLNQFEQIKHLHLADLTLPIIRCLFDGIPQFGVVQRGTESQSKTEVSVDVVEILTLDVAW